MKNQAALYLRSSKDRSDVSIAAQRRELYSLAKQRNLVIVDEYVDAVESGSTENRPGFQDMFNAIKSRERAWDTILLLDTSRLSRRQYISHFFEYECEKKNVTLIYKSLPVEDPISAMMLKAVLQAMDQWHSMISKQKGLAGMSENVKQGFRAGGSAPRGYSLEKVTTKTIRDGVAVTKSRLIPNDDAELVAELLSYRAKGLPRQRVHDSLDIKWPTNSTLSMEWNALTYAGHTVWNVHAERREGKSITGMKRRPRSEWHIKENTHQALISHQQAEMILSQLESKQRTSKTTKSIYLLSGLLYSAETGEKYHGDRAKYYRLGKSTRIQCDVIDDAVMNQVLSDLQSNYFIKAITNKAREKLDPKTRNVKRGAMTRKIDDISKKIIKLMDLITEVDDTAPYMARIKDLNMQRDELELKVYEIERLEMDSKDINEFDIKRALASLATELQALDRVQLKDMLAVIISKINVLGGTPQKHKPPRAEIHYRINSRGVVMASPRGFEPLLPP